MEQSIFCTGEVRKPLKMLFDIKNYKMLVQLITNIVRYAKPFKTKFPFGNSTYVGDTQDWLKWNGVNQFFCLDGIFECLMQPVTCTE